MANPIVPARGMRDILPSDKAKRDFVLNTIADVYQQSGYQPIETPAVEPLTRLTSGQGGDNEKMLFQIMKRGLGPDEQVTVSEAADLGLRFDLTVPLTRYYASNINELPRVFRAFQAGPVWRAERPQKGRFRQFVQCDIDILGDDSITAEVDLVVTTLTALGRLGLGSEVKVLVNDRRVLLDILALAGVEEADSGPALVALDKMDKIGFGGVHDELVSQVGLTTESADTLLGIVQAVSDEDGRAQAMSAGAITSEGHSISLRDLPSIAEAVRALVPGARIEFDATLVRGMGYYTGPIFEIKHEGRDYSIAGGGRYDKVVGKWLGRDVPACGFSIGFERIIDLVETGDTSENNVALLYKPGSDPVNLLTLREQVIANGARVGLVVPPRRLGGAFFDGLLADGYTHVLDTRNGDASVSDIRELQ